MSAESKQRSRAEAKAERCKYSSVQLQEWSARIASRLLGELQDAKAIALFWPMANEVDLRVLDGQLRMQGKRLYYPYMERLEPKLVQEQIRDQESGFVPRYQMGFRATGSPDDLKAGAHGFLAPAQGQTEALPGQLDAIVVPALLVSLDGYRLGYGAGFYDAMLARFAPPARSLVVAFEFQVVEQVPREAHDQAFDSLITEGRVYRSG